MINVPAIIDRLTTSDDLDYLQPPPQLTTLHPAWLYLSALQTTLTSSLAFKPRRCI